MKKLLVLIVVGMLSASVVLLAVASYPSSTKSFSTRIDGQTIAAAWFNELQDEVVAIENGLRLGVDHDLLPLTDGARDLGTVSKNWRDGWFSRNVDIEGTLAADGATTLGGALTVAGATTLTGGVAGAASFTGVITASAQPRARVYNTTNQSLTSGAGAAITFNTETFDVGSIHDTSSNTSRLTVPTGGDGLYLLIGNVEFANTSASGERRMWLQKNTSTTLAVSYRSSVSTNQDESVSVSTLAVLAAGDYIEVFGLQTSGGALNVIAAENGTYLTFVKLW